MKINYIYFCIVIFLYFIIAFPAFIIPIKMGAGAGFSVGIIGIFGLLLYFLTFHAKKVLSNIKALLKFNAAKILLLYFCLNIVLILIHTILGDNGPIKPMLSFLYKILIIIIPLFFGFYIVQYFKLRNLIKIYYVIIYLTLFLGLLEFIIFFFNIDVLENIYNMINNVRLILNGHITRAYSGIFPRIQSGFDEPAYFAFFLDVHLPLIYNISFSKYKVFSNKYINIFVKKSCPILLWFIILGIQSPIHIIIALCITLFYILIKASPKKRQLYIWGIGIVCCSAIYVVKGVDLSTTFLGRIQNVINAINLININTIIFADESLGTRLISYVNAFCVFLAHPLIGCGTGNFLQALTIQSLKSPVPYTVEYAMRMAKPGFAPTNANILYVMLAELGIFATITFYLFIICLIITIRKYSQKAFGIYRDFLQGCFLMLIVYICLTFYESLFIYFWVEFGLILGFLSNFKMRIRRGNIQ